MVLVSVDTLFSFLYVLQVPSSILGYLAWSTFVLTTICLGYHFWKELSVVFCLFFLLGYSVGPFLEPPGDPLDHLRNTYSACGKTTDELRQTNKGLWQYSMVGNILCHDPYTVAPKDVLHRIDIANGAFWATSASILFVLGVRAGLPAGWAFFSVCLAFLFMGTNRFSYFSYYSFAPSLSSLWVFWLWIAAFFFKTQSRYLFPGMLTAGLSLCILSVNHIQEAIFLSLICGVWLFLYLLRAVAGYFPDDHRLWQRTGWWLFLVSLFFIFFVLPQWSVFQEGLSPLFLHDYWHANQEAVFVWQGIDIMGRIWGYRINDTLGFLGFLPVLLVPLFIHPKVVVGNRDKKWQILLLGLSPFLVYCIPLLHFVWLSNCTHLSTHIRYYYRICYSSLFWLPVALILYNLGLHLQHWLRPHPLWSRKVVNGLFLPSCLICFAVISRMQSAPLYGKLDFIMVDSRKWWDAWQPMIEEVVNWQKEEIETDYITGYVLHAVFHVPLKYNNFNLLSVEVAPKRSVEHMIQNSNDERIGCLINLHGFPPTWVPQVTGHWSSGLSQPVFLYQADTQEDMSLSRYLQENSLGTCYVFF